MERSRRETLQALGAGVVTGLAGCSALGPGDEQEYAPVVFENSQDRKRVMSVSVITVPRSGLGYQEFFSEVALLAPGGEETFEEGLVFTDTSHDLMALAVLDDETAMREEFTFGFPFNELRVSIDGGGGIQISAV
ncbi:hypothetical protein ACFQH6_11910 [Halobacteriaceae archaeon GCM10025711]